MANYCNKICHDYYCEMNAKGRCHAPNPCFGYEEAAELISELEAAKREIAALRKRERGDCAKLRDALSDACFAMFNLLRTQNGGYEEMANALDKAKSALAEPARNYEVGTAMEQGERFSAYCRAHKHPESECLPCPLFGQTGGHCELAWAQLPYEEGGAK